MARGKPAEQGKILERQLQALQLRKNGMSYRAIGERLGVSHVQAYNDVHDELKRLASQVTSKTEELRQLELERLDMLLEGLWPMAAVGNTGAVMSWLKVSERRAKLLGLDAPEKVEQSGSVTIRHANELTDDELARIATGSSSGTT